MPRIQVTLDLVFAKMKGFPHWPARVNTHTHTHTRSARPAAPCSVPLGSVPPENVVPYIGNKLKYGSGVRIKGFTEGMWEIQNSPGLGSKLKVGLSVVLCVWGLGTTPLVVGAAVDLWFVSSV
uniref:PWWP domain-containing protein n=1 Tax=Nothobranchius furzeri TaxID=105023 RepID=A0A8C6LHH2_NOTFU